MNSANNQTFEIKYPILSQKITTQNFISNMTLFADYSCKNKENNKKICELKKPSIIIATTIYNKSNIRT